MGKIMRRWGDIISATGAVLTSLLSCAFCPLCIPFYAGLLSILGFKIGNVEALLIPGMLLFTLLSLGFMAYQIHTHKGRWTPFKLGVLSALGMVSCALLNYEILLYVCLASFMGSIFWNKRILTHTGHDCC